MAKIDERLREEAKARTAKNNKEAEDEKAAVANKTYDTWAKKYANELKHNPPGTANGWIDRKFDSAGDKLRSVGKKLGTNKMTSQDDDAKMQARKDVKGYKKGGSVRGDGCCKRGKTKGRMV